MCMWREEVNSARPEEARTGCVTIQDKRAGSNRMARNGAISNGVEHAVRVGCIQLYLDGSVRRQLMPLTSLI